MSTKHSTSSDPDAPPLVLRQVVEALTYAGVLVAIAFVVTGLAGQGLAMSFGCSVTRGLVLGKQLMFFGGFAVLAYGAFRLRPGSPRSRGGSAGSRLSGGLGGLGGGIRNDGGGRDAGSDDDDDHESNPQSQRAQDTPHPEIDESGDEDAETGFQRLVQATPPMRFFELAPKDRVSVGAKILLAGVLMLVVTMVMEFGFGLYNVPC